MFRFSNLVQIDQQVIKSILRQSGHQNQNYILKQVRTCTCESIMSSHEQFCLQSSKNKLV
ncbi:hypothetical protein HanIR_Chr11g0526931 [Helianthus annuus]|nr:hypothetical protein HanIR_Chr11g0526931 [Helianthus annuus]